MKLTAALDEPGDLDRRALHGSVGAAYPREGTCDPGQYRQWFPMQGKFVREGGERYMEYQYGYMSFDTGACEVRGSPTPTTERWYRIHPRNVANVSSHAHLSERTARLVDDLSDDLYCLTGEHVHVTGFGS